MPEYLIPVDWTNAESIILFKKGDITNIENYRPISLLSQMYKLFTRIIANRLTNKLDSYQSVEQAGFRKGYSTALGKNRFKVHQPNKKYLSKCYISCYD